MNRYIKKNLWLGLILLFFAYSHASINNYDQAFYDSLTHKNITANNTVFAFDLHGVILNRDFSKITKKVFWAIYKGMYRYAFSPFFWYKVYQLNKQNLTAEDIFNKLEKEYPYIKNFKADFYEVANTTYPIKPMVDFLKILKKSNYKLYLLSNIGTDTYNYHKESDADLFILFDATFLPSRENNYLSKPDFKYFQVFIEYLKKHKLDDRQIIFVDDIKANVDSANRLGIASILFKTYEKFSDLLKTLKIELIYS